MTVPNLDLVDIPRVELPTSNDPIYPPDDAPGHGEPVPKFGDSVWTVRFFTKNPSVSNSRITWGAFDAKHTDHFKIAAWSLFNVPIPTELLTGPSMRTRLSALRIYHTAHDWQMLSRWLADRGVEALRELDADLMSEYARYLRVTRKVARNTAVNHLTAITRLWIAGVLIPSVSLAEPPPWVTGKLEDFLPERASVLGNSRDALAPEVIAPLIVWACKVVTGCAEAVHRAHTLREQLAHPQPNVDGRAQGARDRLALQTWFEELQAANSPFPTKKHNGERNGRIDQAWICHITHAAESSVTGFTQRDDVRKYARANGAPASFDLRLSGDVARVFPAHIDVSALQSLINTYRAACFIVISYLTGMRPGEVLGLRTGSLRPSSHDAGWMLLDAHEFKTARDDEGNHDSGGQVRAAPWVAVAPVVEAIENLEVMLPSGSLLFPTPRNSPERSMALSTVADWCDAFAEHINANLPGTIPKDPFGRLSPSRFRRTLAWHIANQPGGIVALAIQYGHLRTSISQGYASRAREGFQGLVDFETTLTIARQLLENRHKFDDGGGVSGPSAHAFIQATEVAAAQYEGIVLTRRQSKEILSNPALQVFVNDEQFLACNFVPARALCLNGPRDDTVPTPRLDNCKSECQNVARTDEMVEAMEAEAEILAEHAAVSPKPLAMRLNRRVTQMREMSDEHHRTRITKEDL